MGRQHQGGQNFRRARSVAEVQLIAPGAPRLLRGRLHIRDDLTAISCHCLKVSSGNNCAIVGCHAGSKRKGANHLSFHKLPKEGSNDGWRQKRNQQINCSDPSVNPRTPPPQHPVLTLQKAISSRHFLQAVYCLLFFLFFFFFFFFLFFFFFFSRKANFYVIHRQ